MKWRWPFRLCCMVLSLQAHNASGACTEHAARQYQVPAALLRAIAQQESGNNPRALNHNANGSRDLGLMQINSAWLPTLQRYGLHEQDLWDPCVNTLVAAWLLADNFRRWGYTYRALGAYHSPQAQRQWAYAQSVLRRLQSPQSPALSVAVSVPAPAPVPHVKPAPIPPNPIPTGSAHHE